MQIKTNFATGVFTWTKEYLIQVLTTGKNPIVVSPLLIDAINKVDRKDFVPEMLKHMAYNDVELHIGHGESLSKPTIIMSMLQALKPDVGQKILDIGTGTGYVATILGYIVGEKGSVFSIDRIQWLWEQARVNHSKYKPLSPNVLFMYRDGLDGLPQQSPYDRILVSFAIDQIPDALKRQLKVNNGMLVVPTKDYNLRVIERHSIDEFTEEIIPGIYIDQGKSGLA
jgi:protein-L-isoaspartate(D-aspartate) O-methyltransferase